jgi:hypothetical protein
MATSQQKRAAAAAKEKKPESKKNPETKTLSYPPPFIVMPSLKSSVTGVELESTPLLACVPARSSG